MLDNVGLRYRTCFGGKSPRTPTLPLLGSLYPPLAALTFSIQYDLRLACSCRTSLAVSALRIMRYCPKKNAGADVSIDPEIEDGE